MNLRVSTATVFEQGVNAMQRQTQDLVKVQAQLASNQRYTRAGEDPVAAGRALNVDKAMADAAQWQSNIGTAQSRLQLEEGALAGAIGSLDRIRELAVQANSNTLSDVDRQSIAKEMGERFKELIEQANTRDGQGAYVFSGSRTQSPPFALNGSAVQYQGDSLVSNLAIGAHRQIVMGDAGNEVFMATGSGDGRLDVAASSGNQGSGIVQSLSFADASQWDGGSYRVQFGGGNYSVLDSSNVVVGSGAFTSGQSIQFRGASLSITGTPANGDEFSVTPSQTQDIFATVQKLIGAVSSGNRTPAQASRDQTTFYSALQGLDTALDHLGGIRGGVGARLNALDDTRDQLEARSIELKDTLSGLREIDYVEASARLAQTQTGLQAAQQSYLKIQGLSLFDYLR